MNKTIIQSFKSFREEKEKLEQHLEKLIDIGLSLDRKEEIITNWRYQFTGFTVEDEGVYLNFEYPDGDFCDSSLIPWEAIETEEKFKQWLLASINKLHKKEERIKQLKKEAKIQEELKITKEKLLKELGNLQYQKYAQIEFYGKNENSEEVKELDSLIKQTMQKINNMEK